MNPGHGAGVEKWLFFMNSGIGSGGKRRFALPVCERFEPRQLLTVVPIVLDPSVFPQLCGLLSLQGTDGNDRIIVSFDEVSGDAIVSGAAGIADWTHYPDTCNFVIE